MDALPESQSPREASVPRCINSGKSAPPAILPALHLRLHWGQSHNLVLIQANNLQPTSFCFVFLQNLLKNFIQMNWYALPASYLASLVENQSWSAKSTKLTAFLRSLRWIFEEVALENSIIQVQCGLKRLGRHLIEDGTSSRDAESPSNMKILKYLPHRLSSFCNIPPSNHHLVFHRTRCKRILFLMIFTA